MANFNTQLYSMKQKGYLSYEYNPFHNYQTDVDLYKVKTNYGAEILVPEGKAIDVNTGQILTKKNNSWINKYGDVVNTFKLHSEGTLYAKAGSLIDLDTD
jgi:hypothetical protein